MITILLFITLFMFIACVISVMAGLIAIAPALLLIFLLPLIDMLVFKLLFCKKKKDKKKD